VVGDVLSMDVRHTDSETVLTVVGEIDMTSSPQLRRALLEVCDLGPARLTVNLSGVTYIDSSGMATLVEARRRTREAGGELVLQGLRERIMAVFRLARLDEVFRIVE